MQMLSRLSGWFERMLDVPDNDDVLDEELARDGLFMAPVKAAPPVLPQLAVRPEGEATAEARAPEGAAVAEQTPAITEPTSARPAIKVVSFADMKDDDADGQLSGDEEPTDEEPADDAAPEAGAAGPEALASEPEAAVAEAPPAEPALHVVGGVGPPEGEVDQPEMIAASSSNDLLSTFANSAQKSEYAEFTEDMEDVPATQVLAEAREILDILAPGGSPTGATPEEGAAA